jgi:hypothetical protein
MNRRRLPALLATLLLALLAALGPLAATAGADAWWKEGRFVPAYRFSLVGALRLDPYNQGVHADVGLYKDLAFVGKWRGPCPATGVDIIDVANPAAPVKLADTADYPDTSMEDMAAARIGDRDVLAIGLQDCGNDPAAGQRGLELVDITDPRRPRTLSLYNPGGGGVHELDLTTTPSGRVLALLAVPGVEAATAGPDGRGGRGDLFIVDVSDPERPALLSEWGVLDEPALGRAFAQSVAQGTYARALLHSVRAKRNGTRAYLSYWDAGVIALDIADPARPVYLGRTSYEPLEEGNAHSIDETADGRVLVEADEDFSPVKLELTIAAPGASGGPHPASEGAFTPSIATLRDRTLRGEVVHVGRGCPAGTPGAPPDGDPYPNVAGKIALLERGLCPFDHKIARAQQAGAIAAIVYNDAGGGEELLTMSGANPVANAPASVAGTRLTIPALFVRRSAGLALRDAPGGQPVSVEVRATFKGWGYLRLWDVADPRQPRRLGSFATANATDEAVANRGSWSVHNPELRGNLLVASWYSDGVRAIDISRPEAPRELAAWTGQDRPTGAPPPKIWGVALRGDLVFASDQNYGLYVLRLAP